MKTRVSSHEEPPAFFAIGLVKSLGERERIDCALLGPIAIYKRPECCFDRRA